MHSRAIPGRSCLVKVHFCLSEHVLDGYQGLKVFHFMGTCGVNPVLLVMLTIDLDDSDGKSDVDGGDGDVDGGDGGDDGDGDDDDGDGDVDDVDGGDGDEWRGAKASDGRGSLRRSGQ